MRKSQQVLLAALGTVVVVTIGIGAWVRIVVPPAPPRPPLSGEVATRAFDLKGFDGVEIRGPWQVTLTRGDAWSVEATVPVELQDEVVIELEGDRIVVQSPRAWWRDFEGDSFGRRDEASLTVEITMPAVEDAQLSGASMLAFSGFDGAELSIASSGAAKIDGRASRFDELNLLMSGAGQADLREVSVTDARVTLSGATNVTLRMAGGELTGQMSGVGNLEYYGSVSAERVVKSGLVNVRQAD